MDGHRYEYVCADVLRGKGFINVSVTKGSGDQGVDVIAYKNGRKYAIQCKYYSRPVSNSAVQEVVAGARYYGCDSMIVMTNSTFTKSAKELARANGVELWEHQSESGFGFGWLKWFAYFVLVIGVFTIFQRAISNHSSGMGLIIAQFLIFGVIFWFGKHFDFERRSVWFLFLKFNLISYIVYIGLTFIFVALETDLEYSIWEMFTSWLVVLLICAGSQLLFTVLPALVKQRTGESGKRKRELKKLNREIKETIAKMGQVYVDLFQEEYHIDTTLISSKEISDKTYEFILKCDTDDHADYLVYKQSELNEKIHSRSHMISDLGKQKISLVVSSRKEAN